MLQATLRAANVAEFEQALKGEQKKVEPPARCAQERAGGFHFKCIDLPACFGVTVRSRITTMPLV